MSIESTSLRKHVGRALTTGLVLAATAGVGRAQQPPAPIEKRSPEEIIVGGVPPPPPLTPGQKMVADQLGPPKPLPLLPIPPIPPEGPWPSADPHDLSGTWIHDQALVSRMATDMYDMAVPHNETGAKALIRRTKSNDAGTPYLNASAKCRPPGTPWQRDLNFPFQVFQTKDTVEFVFEEFHGRWNIALDPSRLPPGKSYMGRSVGRWQGDTLVVETTGFRQSLWLDPRGNPFSANGKMVERIRKVDNGDKEPFLEIVTTVYDPVSYTKPWSFVRTYGWRPNLTLFKEYNCEEQIGDQSVDANSGLVAEPEE